MTPAAGDGEPSIFDDDAEAKRLARRRELRRIRSVLITTAFLILLPVLVAAILQTGLFPLDVMFWGFALAIVAVYTILGNIALRRPFTALLGGLGIYVAIQLATFWYTPSALYHNWIFRGIVVLNLIMPLQKAKALQS
jgi:hypothetical protein